MSVQVSEKNLEEVLVAGYRMQATYEEMGKGLEKLFASYGDIVAGAPLTLYYDIGFKEIADYEVCVPIKEVREIEGFNVRKLHSGKAISVIHKGGYDKLMNSWNKVWDYVKDKGLKTQCPSREHYLVGPESTQNPDEYTTEIQILLD